MNRIRRPRLLFFAEAVTLAQVARLAALACGAAAHAEVHFASARFPPLVFDDLPARRWPVDSLSPKQAERAVAWGLRLYSRRTLARYVEADRRLFDAVQPDWVIGDLRWSLAVSGPLHGVKVASLANAYWSPFAVRHGWPLPEHPIVRLLGPALAARHFPAARGAVFRHFAAPLDALRERHGLAPLGSLEQVLTWGDVTLYADPPELVPVRDLPASHRFLGAVQWAPAAGDVPEELGRARPLVYATLGSSGSLRALPAVLGGLARLDVDVLLATADRAAPALPANVRALPFVRGDLAARRAAVVLSNGGSSTGYQALAQGAPVVGVPYNLDQYLASEAIDRFGAGVSVRSGAATPEAIAAAVSRALHDGALREHALRAATALARLDPVAELGRALDLW